jgi:hypothetical protein
MSPELEHQLAAAFHEDAQRARLVNPEHPAVELADDEKLREAEHRRRPWLLVAAATVAVLAIGLAAVVNDPDRDQTNTVPLEPGPATNPATTTPATLPATTAPAPVTGSSAPVDSRPSETSVPPTPADVPPLWVELEPGATAALPPAPIPALDGSDLVWTGTELIVWGGIEDDQPCCTESNDGAAFDPAEGTWRQIAPAPDGIGAGVVLWTDSEMIVWNAGTPDTVSAAYDPAGDTWRSISDPPFPDFEAFWTGETALAFGDSEPNGPAYAYDPSTDEWRRLADGSWTVPAVWTGSRIVSEIDPSSDTGAGLTSYDPVSDTWEILDGSDALAGGTPVVIGAGSAGASVAVLPESSETSINLLDEHGNEIGEIAGRPADLASTCEKTPGDTSCLFDSTRAVSLGGELLFWVREEGWSLDLESQTWRPLQLDLPPPTWGGTEVVAAGELLFVWGEERGGLVYRATTPLAATIPAMTTPTTVD